MKTKSVNFYVVIFALSLLISIIFYHTSLNYYFFQDDFFEINISKVSNLRQYLEFFLFRPDIIAYRPISLQNFFFFSSSIFGLNPVGFRFVSFIFFLANGLLISKVIAKITKSQKAGLFCAALWATSSIHFLSLTWIAAAYMIIGTFFFFITSFFFLKFLESKRVIFYVAALFSFLITVGSFEFSITWPAIFAIYYVYLLKKKFIDTLKLFWPFAAISLIYLTLRLLLIRVPDIYEYAVTINVNSAKALFWYLLWLLNIPEEFKKQVVDNLLIFNSKFLEDFFPLVVKTFWGALAVLTLVIIVPLVTLARRRQNPNWRLLAFFIFWFLAAISPVLLIPNHTFIMYLALASVGVYGAIAYLLTATQKIFLVTLVIVIWIWTSAVTLTFYKHNFWMIEAQKTAGEFAVNIKRQFPTLPKDSVILYPLQGQFRKQALLENQAIRTLYNDETLLIYYNKEDLRSDYPKIRERPIYIYLPE